MPIHFRYQPPSSDCGYVPVLVPSPVLMVPHPLGPAPLPCHADTRDTCLWALVAATSSEDGGKEPTPDMRAPVPCGTEGIVSTIVTIVTCLVTLSAMFVLFYAVVATPLPWKQA